MYIKTNNQTEEIHLTFGFHLLKWCYNSFFYNHENINWENVVLGLWKLKVWNESEIKRLAKKLGNKYMLYEKRGEKDREKQEVRRTRVELRHSPGKLTGKGNKMFNIIYSKCLVWKILYLLCNFFDECINLCQKTT